MPAKATARGQVKKVTEPLRVAYCPLCQQSWAVPVADDPDAPGEAAREHAAVADHGMPLYIGEVTL